MRRRHTLEPGPPFPATFYPRRAVRPGASTSSRNPGNIVAVREGITVLIVAHIPTTGQIRHCLLSGGQWAVHGPRSFTAGNKPVTLARGSDAFTASRTTADRVHVAPCNGAGVIAADTPEATDPQTTAIDVLAFNL